LRERREEKRREEKSEERRQSYSIAVERRMGERVDNEGSERAGWQIRSPGHGYIDSLSMGRKPTASSRVQQSCHGPAAAYP
jgi:hypothetical protein